MEVALEAGADDIITSDHGFEVRCDLHDFDKVIHALEDAAYVGKASVAQPQHLTRHRERFPPAQVELVAELERQRSPHPGLMARRRRFGVELDPACEVLATSGSMEAIFHLPMILVDPSSGRDRVVYGVPGYRVFEIGTYYAEGRAHAVDLTAENGYLLDPDQIGEDVLSETGLVFLNYPHNPTGQELPDELFERWVAARDRHGFVLVSDEVYADIYFERPCRSLLEFGREGCLVIHSLSKRSSMTGYQTGLFAGDADLLATLRRFRASMGLSSPVWTQAAATAAWLDDDHVDDKRALLKAKRDVMLELFQARGLQVYPGTSTLYLWVEVPESFTDTSYAEHLIELGIVVSPGSNFGPNQERFFRVALAPDVAECRDVAALWP